MGYIKVACVQSADKRLQRLCALQRILAIVDQTDLVMNVVGQLVAFFNTYNAAALLLRRLVDGADHFFCLS